ncbi:MAG: glutaredoxin family protein [Candidatus Methylomirabilaceae bacterium]
MDREPIRMELYTKADCGLCREMKAVIEGVRGDYPLALREFDITSDPSLMARFAEEIPVLFLDGRKAFKFRTSERGLRRALEAILLRRRMLRAVGKRVAE